MHAARVHPQQALAVYVESFAAGARVAVFGDASLGLGERLIGLGARAVHVWDPDADRASGRFRADAAGLVVEPYDAYVAPVGTVDVAIVPELGRFDDPAELVARVRDLVGDEGIALIGAANASVVSPVPGDARAFDYYELFDRVAVEFSSVRMVAELQFVGVALVALGEVEETPAVSVDTQLADPDRAPLAFLAIASQTDVPLDPFAIIEVGPDERDEEEEEDEIAAAAAEQIGMAAAEQSAFAAAERDAIAVAERNAMVAAERNATAAAERHALAAAEQSAIAGAARRAADEASDRADEAELRLRGEMARVLNLETALAVRERQLGELSVEVEEVRAAAEAGRIAAAEVEAIARRADRAEARAVALERETVALAENQAAELLRLEGALRERAQAARLLEAEVVRRDRIVRDLVAALEEAGPAPAPEADVQNSAPAAPATPMPRPVADVASSTATEEAQRLREQLDGLALEVARREGDAQAMAWTVAELERRLALADRNGAASSHVLPAPTRDLEAEAEMEVLRKALVQEHEARRRAESGEALAAAQTEIARLTLLLEQAERERAGSGDGADARPHAGVDDAS
jgi:hypothetical protein